MNIIQDEKSLQLKPGTQVAYVPNHVEGDLTHPDVQYGFVTAVHTELQTAHVRYFYNPLKHPGNSRLRTTANSESTRFDNLVVIEHMDPLQVDILLEELGYKDQA